MGGDEGEGGGAVGRGNRDPALAGLQAGVDDEPEAELVDVEAEAPVEVAHEDAHRVDAEEGPGDTRGEGGSGRRAGRVADHARDYRIAAHSCRVRLADGRTIAQDLLWCHCFIDFWCLRVGDHLRSARARRESYVGPWLPEPVVQEGEPAVDRRIEMAESVSMAFMLVLEALSPVERAVFLLRWCSITPTRRSRRS